ncbi:MAG: hypothetical protein JWP29_5548, partial [Rhodoferax sp.]|nr:hypothetical protein [Rhodoferax sp.]
TVSLQSCVSAEDGLRAPEGRQRSRPPPAGDDGKWGRIVNHGGLAAAVMGALETLGRTATSAEVAAGMQRAKENQSEAAAHDCSRTDADARARPVLAEKVQFAPRGQHRPLRALFDHRLGAPDFLQADEASQPWLTGLDGELISDRRKDRATREGRGVWKPSLWKLRIALYLAERNRPRRQPKAAYGLKPVVLKVSSNLCEAVWLEITQAGLPPTNQAECESSGISNKSERRARRA